MSCSRLCCPEKDPSQCVCGKLATELGSLEALGAPAQERASGANYLAVEIVISLSPALPGPSNLTLLGRSIDKRRKLTFEPRVDFWEEQRNLLGNRTGLLFRERAFKMCDCMNDDPIPGDPRSLPASNCLGKSLAMLPGPSDLRALEARAWCGVKGGHAPSLPRPHPPKQHISSLLAQPWTQGTRKQGPTGRCGMGALVGGGLHATL